MSDTRKQLIELLEPYMDKSLSEGCYFLDEVLGIKKIGENTDNANMGYCFYDYFCELQKKVFYKNRFGEETYDDIAKILGHYDITAVLKYISEHIGTYNISVDGVGFYIEDNNGISAKSFPNKPLNLYSQQEEKVLLKLLLELGKQ